MPPRVPKGKQKAEPDADVEDEAPAAKKPKGKQKAEPDADVEDEAPAAKKTKGKQKAEPDADVEDEAPAAKKTKPEKVKKKPMRRPDHGEVIYCVEYAASNRSTCKECGEKIEQGLVRLGLAVPGKGDWDDISWRHPKCFMEPLEVSEEETLTAASQIERYEDLEEKDQKMIDTWFAQASKMPRKERAVLEAAAEAAAEDGGRSSLLGTLLQGASFKEREQLGSLGARFDYRSKTWFVPYGKDAAPFAKWLGAGAAAAIAAHAVASAEGGTGRSGAGGSQDVPMPDAHLEIRPVRPTIAPEVVAKMSMGELKEELSARGLGTSGKKAELVGKLREALETALENPTAAPDAPTTAPDAPTNASGRRVDRAVPGGAQYAVYEDYDVKLSESSLVDGANVNKYYFCQVLQKQGGTFATYFKYGKIGETEYGDKLDGPFERAAEAIQSFEAKFHEKTRGKKDKSPKEAAWAAYKAGQFEKRDGYYGVIETKVGEPGGAGGAADDWQKNLDDKQIEKGKAALAAIKSALSDEDKALDTALIAKLSTEYYRAIPTSSGRKAPPPLDSLAVVGEKEHQLEFWLRMGFEKTGTIVDNPLGGLWDLALPPTLKEACLPYGVSDLGSISSSVARGKLLAKSRAGGPIKSMSADKYGAIVLYTGNSIYRELNRALREVHAEVPKYLRYLRLLFEAMDAMPTRTVRLWRGIAADLYDEYEPGKVITWWSVSSTTADESVARGFMSQLGGVASLIILDTKSALDITPLSVYPKEKESLLAPGTRLKVLSRTRHGNINEIHVEEIDTAVEPRPAHALVAAPEPSAVAGASADEEAEHPYSRFSVEAAKSNRSTCKGCGLKIDKGEVRIGCELEDLDGEFGGHAITQWRHVHCVKPSWVKLDELDGLRSLNKAGKTSIEAWHKPNKK